MPEPAKPGEYVQPLPLWSQTSRPASRLPGSVKVLDVRRGQSQTGLMYLVEIGGRKDWLDSGWFLPGTVDPPQLSETAAGLDYETRKPLPAQYATRERAKAISASPKTRETSLCATKP